MYRIYTSECLQAIVGNTARFNGGNVVELRYFDLINPKKRTKEKTGDEIVAEVFEKLGLEV